MCLECPPSTPHATPAKIQLHSCTLLLYTQHDDNHLHHAIPGELNAIYRRFVLRHRRCHPVWTQHYRRQSVEHLSAIGHNANDMHLHANMHQHSGGLYPTVLV